MEIKSKPEVWQRGAVEGVTPLLQPVAHAVMQAGEEVAQLVTDFPDSLLWQKPAGVASVGFHLQHLTGVLDRLFTYARGEALSAAQLNQLSIEGKEIEGTGIAAQLDSLFGKQVNNALRQLKSTDPATLTDPRFVGRARIPSTVIGLLFHAAEHTMRHVGQLYVTVKILQDKTQQL